MHDLFKIIVVKQTESSAHVVLELPAGVPIRSLTGKIVGPYCNFARTLPAEFSLTDIKSNSDIHVAQVIDPCYWTPELPFLYDLHLGILKEDGQEIEQTLKVGLTRWGCESRNLRLESRRIVLRGTSSKQLATATLSAAREAATALMVDRYDQPFCGAADQAGVMLCLDLRAAGNSLYSVLPHLDWSPSVLLALVSAEQLAESDLDDHRPTHCCLTQSLSASSTPDELVDPQQVLAVELKPGEQPPAWLADFARPVIAIRHGEDYAELTAARAACDRLQAELAPEFDLAGYFVTP